MNKVGILGTGMVGHAIGRKLISLGYDVMMGSRTSNNEKAAQWVNIHEAKAFQGTFADAAFFGDMIILCTKGDVTLDVINLAKIENFSGKVVIDISNPLDFSKGMPATLFVCNTDSMGEQIQRLLPDALVVKTLNIVSCDVMIDPKKSGGDPTMFVSGNDEAAKQKVTELLKDFGWIDIVDLGDISTARGPEMMLPIWLRAWSATKKGHIAFKLLR